MRVETTTRELFTFEELTETAQQTAMEKLWDINVDYEWWDFTYMDAEMVGIKITSFDLDRRRSCEGEIYDPQETAEKILKEHGETCGTYILAETFLKERDKMVDKAPKDENGDLIDEYTLDSELDDLEEQFTKDLLEEYSIILQKEYEYLTSEEVIKETVLANEYEFTSEGKFA